MRKSKVRLITTIICMILALIALYAFCFVINVSSGWRIALIIISASWMVSGIMNLFEYFQK